MTCRPQLREYIGRASLIRNSAVSPLFLLSSGFSYKVDLVLVGMKKVFPLGAEERNVSDKYIACKADY